MDQDPDIEILVHNTATTNAQADARYREQALAYLNFRGTRLELDYVQDISDPASKEMEMKDIIEEENNNAQKKRLLLQSSPDVDHDARRKRVLLDSQPAVQVESSPVYIPMSPLRGFTQPPLAYSISPEVVKSSFPALSTFVCEPGVQRAFTLEPVTPQLPNISVVPETVLRAATQMSPLAKKDRSASPMESEEECTPEIPETPNVRVVHLSQTVFTLNPITPLQELSVIPETVIRPPAAHNSQQNLENSSSIEWGSGPSEIPDSQPTPPKGRGLLLIPVEKLAASDPSENTTVTHVSQSPIVAQAGSGKLQSNQQQASLLSLDVTKVEETPKQALIDKRATSNGVISSQRGSSGTEAVALVNDTTIVSVIEMSPSADVPKTPIPKRIIQYYPPAPRFEELSPLSPLQHSVPETCTSPDKLPHKFPVFTGQPISTRSLLAYMLEKDLDSIDRQLLEKDRYNIDRRQVNRFLELRQLGEYNIASPPPAVNSNPKQITPLMEKIYANAKLDKYFRPKTHAREMRKRERGYWRIDMSRWPKLKSSKDKNKDGVGTKSTAEKKHAFWTRLAGYVKDGKLGETRLFFESESEGAGEKVGDILRLYCYGEVAIHIWVILYAISDRIVSELGLKWVDAGGHTVIEM